MENPFKISEYVGYLQCHRKTLEKTIPTCLTSPPPSIKKYQGMNEKESTFVPNKIGYTNCSLHEKRYKPYTKQQNMNNISYNTAEETALKLAERITQEVQKADKYHLALSGGTDAVHVYRALVAAPIEWEKVHIYFTYEVVSGTKAGFNYTLADAHLFSKVNIPAENIHRIALDVTPDTEADRYANEELTLLPRVDGKPRFDFALIEMGDDGHTVGIYPGQEELFWSEQTYISNQIPNSNDHLVTTTFGTLECAKTVAFYAFSGKSRFIIGNIVNLMAEAKAYPANYLAAHCPWIFLYADAESMSEKSYSIY